MKKNINQPLVSIIIPVFNGTDFLTQAIDSALAQTYQNKEIVVVNDGSNDQGATEAIALSYGNKITYYAKENGGVATALNFGIKKMKGKYFSWLSHDDLYTPDKIENQILEMLQHDDRTILYSDYRVFEKDPSESFEIRLPGVPPQDFRYWLTVENRLHGCTLLVPKSAFEEHGLFNPDLRTTQDYDLWFKLAKTYKFIHSPRMTVFGRSHPNQGTIFLSKVAMKECDELIISFMDQLEPHEIIHATQKALKFGYQAIALSCLKRGFINADIHANELAKLNGLRQPLYYCKRVRTMQGVIYKKMRSFLKKVLSLKYKFFLKDVVAIVPDKKDTHQQINHLEQTHIELLSTCLEEKFTQVYRENIFAGTESRSGEGSNLIQSAAICREIPKIIKAHNISTFLDAPCGDWHWMSNVDLGVQRYIGVDIVPELIEKNSKKFGSSKVSFQKVNLVEDQLPQADLVFSRDCLVHLNYTDAKRIIANFKKSGAKYLLTTTFTNRDKNTDLIDALGNDLFWRTLNMQIAPFNFPSPLELINEGCTEGDGLFRDKCLGLWLLEDIKVA
jgi:glycosyltransferase involved in cell wall biosynthesis